MLGLIINVLVSDYCCSVSLSLCLWPVIRSSGIIKHNVSPDDIDQSTTAVLI